MELNFYTLSVIYLVYSFLGWVGETVVATAKGRRFTNRGVASGPFCFVYGTAGVLLAVGLADLRNNWFALFAGSFLIATVVEWITAKLLERDWNCSYLYVGRKIRSNSKKSKPSSKIRNTRCKNRKSVI